MVEQQKLTIIGTGFIGTSLGLALKGLQPPFLIVGHDRKPEKAKAARAKDAIDKAEGNLIASLEGAALVFIATPLPGVREVLEKGRTHFLGGTILTDTATSKEIALKWAAEFLPDNVHFIGGHPIIVDSGESGEEARADLFHAATWCLVPSPTADPQAAQTVAQLVQALGAQPFFMDAAEHDGQVAALEHLPPVLAALLFRLACYSPAWRDMTRLVSPTFRQATSLADTDPQALSEMAMANPDNLSRWIDLYVEELRHFQKLLKDEEREALESLFSDPSLKRGKWLSEGQEELPSPGIEEVQKRATLGRLLGRGPRRQGKE